MNFRASAVIPRFSDERSQGWILERKVNLILLQYPNFLLRFLPFRQLTSLRLVLKRLCRCVLMWHM
ncbi:hypothetical protein PAECIP111893_00405 [Paenibacillus plantiphilus]|uniref:Uncharacterized protein n=1 Tax=Paenibacillus plantiphilus TaxID=2905650 RepID=A0ABN8FVJ4_9BACL|nr:hypothetical protein PAECIP111893_00405 [Paenibacillus plantiphilus]